MRKSDLTEQWRAIKINRLRETHTQSLIWLFSFRAETRAGGKSEPIEKAIDKIVDETTDMFTSEPIEKAIDKFNNNFDHAIENPKDFPLTPDFDIEQLEEKFGVQHIYFGYLLAAHCIIIANAFKERFDKEKEMAEFIRDTEIVIDLLVLQSSQYAALQFASFQMKKGNPGGKKRAETAANNLLNVNVMELLENYKTAGSPYRRDEIRTKVKGFTGSNTDRTFYNYLKRYTEKSGISEKTS